MESTQIMMQEKLGFFKLFKEAFTIPLKNPRFIVFTILTSIPLFSSLLVYETIFQHTLIATAKILLQVPPPLLDCDICYDWKNLGFVEKLIEKEEVSSNYLLLVLFYLGILHFLDLISLIAIVDSASTIYAGNNKTMNLKDLFQRFIKETRFKGPLITSISVLLLASLILFGLLSLATHIYIASPYVSLMVLFGVLFVALFAKYIEWSAIWNMGIVISILEEKQGEVALWISSYLSRGNKKRGFLLALVFFVWRLGLRLTSLYVRWFVGGNRMVITATHISLVCLGHVTKWLVFVVYFYDCKKCSRSRSREKNNVEVEESNAAAGGVGGTE